MLRYYAVIIMSILGVSLFFPRANRNALNQVDLLQKKANVIFNVAEAYFVMAEDNKT